MLQYTSNIAKKVNALQINPLDIDASGYVIDTLRIIVLCSCQDGHVFVAKCHLNRRN